MPDEQPFTDRRGRGARKRGWVSASRPTGAGHSRGGRGGQSCGGGSKCRCRSRRRESRRSPYGPGFQSGNVHRDRRRPRCYGRWWRERARRPRGCLTEARAYGGRVASRTSRSVPENVITLSANVALRAAEWIAAIGIFISTAEHLSNWRDFRPDGTYAWRVLRSRPATFLYPRLARVLDVLLDVPAFLIVLGAPPGDDLAPVRAGPRPATGDRRPCRDRVDDISSQLPPCVWPGRLRSDVQPDLRGASPRPRRSRRPAPPRCRRLVSGIAVVRVVLHRRHR